MAALRLLVLFYGPSQKLNKGSNKTGFLYTWLLLVTSGPLRIHSAGVCRFCGFVLRLMHVWRVLLLRGLRP